MSHISHFKLRPIPGARLFDFRSPFDLIFGQKSRETNHFTPKGFGTVRRLDGL